MRIHWLSRMGFISIFMLLYVQVSAQTKSDPIPIGLPENTSWYTAELPISGDFKDLCKSPEGRFQIINSIDSISMRDINFQWQGMLMQGDSTYKSFNSYLQNYVDSRCGGTDGYVFNVMPNYAYFQYVGGPNQPPLECWSENKGGSHKEDCNAVILIKLPDGWQACKAIYSKPVEVRHGRFGISPALWYSQDGNETPRFKGYELRATGHGDVGNPSIVKLYSFKILAIRAEFSNDVRKQCGCEMPGKPLPPPPPPSQITSSPRPAIMKGSLTNIRGNMADLIFTNTGGNRGRMAYKVDAINESGQQMTYEEGFVDLNPGDVYTIGLHKWWVKQWIPIHFRQLPIE